MNILQTSVDLLSGVDVQAESLQERFKQRGNISDLIEHWWDGEYGVIRGDEPREDYRNLDEAMDELVPDYDIVHFHSHSFNWEEKDTVVERSNEKDSPYVVYTAHSAVKDEDDDWYKELQFDHMRDADIVTTVSPYARQRLIEEHEPLLDEKGIDRQNFEDKIEIVPNGTDFDKYVGEEEVEEMASYVKEDYIRRLSPDAERIILFAGRHSSEKGLDDLAEAFNEVGRNHPESVLLYAGANGKEKEPEEEVMTGVASQLDDDVRDRVRFTGRVERDELASLYKAADVFVSPTSKDYDNETFNMTIPEAFMMDTPVVTSDHAAPKELFVDPGYAIGVEPSNPHSIASGIDYVLSNPKEAQERAEAAKQHTLNNYTMESVTDTWINQIYGSLIGEEQIDRTGIRLEDYPRGETLHDSPF